jgi:hypothetical protein
LPDGYRKGIDHLVTFTRAKEGGSSKVIDREEGLSIVDKPNELQN